MREYYIYIDGRQEGPFLLNELKTKALSPDTQVWYAGSGKWMPAKEVAELDEFFHLPNTPTAAGSGGYLSHVIAAHHPSMQSTKATNRLIKGRKGLVIACLLLITLTLGAFLYHRYKCGEDLARKERVRIIRETEVQKALLERRNVRTQEAKKKEAARKALLTQRKQELQSLQIQYQNVKTQYNQALWDLDDIRKPRLFRSGARRDAEIAEQLQITHSLENKARTLDSRINKCQQDIDQLSLN